MTIESAAASDPIVWDGSDEAFGVIRDALSGFGVERCLLYELRIYRGRQAVGRLVLNARIRIVGDSFAILPPEVTP